jgi:hypothetical protein
LFSRITEKNKPEKCQPIQTDRSGCKTMENVTRRQVELIHKSIVSGGCDKSFSFLILFLLFFTFISSGKITSTPVGTVGYKFKRKKDRARLYSAWNHLYISFPFHRDCFNDFPIIKRKKKPPRVRSGLIKTLFSLLHTKNYNNNDVTLSKDGV